MHVLWAHNYPTDVLGAGIFMHQQAKAFRDKGIQLDLHYMGNLRNPGTLIQAYKRIQKLSQNYDLIHAQFGSACGCIVSRLSGVKIISLRGSDWYGNDSGTLLSRIHSVFQKKITLRSLKKYDGIIVMSHRMQRAIKRLNLPNKIWVIPSGINLTMFRPIDRMKAREMLGEAHDETPWVFFPSLLESNSVKRPQLAKEAVSEARIYLPNIKLKIGSGIPHNMMPLFYNASNVVLMSSTHEGWPNSIKEALACNVPFVCTDVSDLNLISQQESNCKVVPARAEVIGKAIADVIAQERSEMLRRHVIDMELTKTAEKICSAYEEVLCAAGNDLWQNKAL